MKDINIKISKENSELLKLEAKSSNLPYKEWCYILLIWTNWTNWITADFISPIL